MPPESDGRLLAIAALSVARVQLVRAETVLRDPKTNRRTWLSQDVARAAKAVEALASRVASGRK